MGLDVYLIHIDDVEKRNKSNAEYQAKTDAISPYEDGKTPTQEEKDAYSAECEKIALALGLDKYGEYPGEVTLEQDSKTKPDHLFKIGYLRSSYNGSGINRMLEKIGLPTLNDIFEPGDEYKFQPDWEAAKDKCESAIAALAGFMATPMADYGIFECAYNIFGDGKGLPNDEKAALQVFKNELDLHAVLKDKAYDSYGNMSGRYFLDGLKVCGFVHGKGFGDAPCTYVIYESKGEWKWYLEALKITLETIEFAICHPERNKLYLHWSS